MITKNPLLITLFFYLIIFLINSTKSDATPPPQNLYKFIKEVKNSLFRERDNPLRMSNSNDGVPPTPEQQ